MDGRTVSIPQAVGAVATAVVLGAFYQPNENSFNTASGRYCCNFVNSDRSVASIQACFNTVNGKYCCNYLLAMLSNLTVACFNTVNGKYCCNEDIMDAKAECDTRFNTVNGKYCCNKIGREYLKGEK